VSEIVAYASLRHYFDHLAPVVEALRNATRAPLGGIEAPPGRPWGNPLRTDRTGAVWLVASFADAQRVAPAPVILLEHGAGQSYGGGDERAARSGSYAGGDGLDHVIAFLCPNDSVAARWQHRYPDARLAVVGVPKLDPWHANGPRRRVRRRPGSGPTVAVTWHWPNTLCPESQWALPHFRRALPDLVEKVRAAGAEIIGHGHPRVWRQLRREWARLGVQPIEEFSTVLDRADLLVVDNSSAGPEFASLDRPVVWCSAPWYRRDVIHGGRFWSWPVGQPHVEEPGDLTAAVLETLVDPDRCADARRAMVATTYCLTDGHAADRAATAIEEITR
jgi:hypothetical protein